jgi:DNA-binding beta-propeller fold protein YncE
MTRALRTVALCAAALAALPAFAGTARIVLPESATTSAGVFDSSGALVRTLWSGQRREAGAISLEWDGRLDDGGPANSGEPYVARVIAHDVRYVWEGVIGNTSDAAQGPSIHRGFYPIQDMAIDAAGNAFYVVGYNERQHGIHRFRTAQPQRQTPLAHDDYRRIFQYAATDGTLAYFANIGRKPRTGREPESASFVIALRVSDGAEHRFSAGRVETPEMHGNRWESVIDYDNSPALVADQLRSAPSGLAVQQRGDFLFVSHRHLNEIRVLDKRSGALLARIPATAPGDMDVAPDDSLWVLCRDGDRPAVAHYRYVDGKWERQASITSGLTAPAAIGVSPVEGTVVVADAGTEQLKAFDEDGSRAWTYGRPGGFADGSPELANDKFWFTAGTTYVTFQPDGSFWVGDPGNLRNLRFSAQRRYLDQIVYMPASYIVAVDLNDPTRVFRHFLEFRVDYSQPLAKSWTLVRNWAPRVDKRYLAPHAGFRSVFTLSNGRTYGTLYRSDSRANEIVELTSTGVRPTGAQLEANGKMYPDGSVRSHRIRLNALRVYSRPLDAFDADGNPKWRAPELLAEIPALREDDPYFNDVPLITGMNEAAYPITSSGVLVSFNPGRSKGFHLGGLKPGRNSWLWRASPSGTWDIDAQGNILNPDGRYELGHGVQYLGNTVNALGRNIVYGYHGEAWNGAQAGQWLHFLDDGLFVGQFGRPIYTTSNRAEVRPESAGNAFSWHLVEAGGETYMWNNDESVAGGIHRWKIANAKRIRAFEAPIRP